MKQNMIILLSPAKKLNFEADARADQTRPALLRETAELAEVTRKLTTGDLMRLMGISEDLAILNQSRFQHFNTRARKETRPAAFVFNGDVYQGLQAASFGEDDLAFAQEHLRILSGLYGLLRPLDGILPYRLEMGTGLANPRGETLYDFWGSLIAGEIGKALEKSGSRTILNLASNEYFKAVNRKALDADIITPVFKDEKEGKFRTLSFFAKRARGEMARWVIKNRVREPEALKDCSIMDYRFTPSLTDKNRWAFTRRQPEPKAA